MSEPKPPSRADVLAMPDAEFDAAVRRAAWRDKPVPAAAAPPATKPALAMTDEEFAAACRAMAWRR